MGEPKFLEYDNCGHRYQVTYVKSRRVLYLGSEEFGWGEFLARLGITIRDVLKEMKPGAQEAGRVDSDVVPEYQ